MLLLVVDAYDIYVCTQAKYNNSLSFKCQTVWGNMSVKKKKIKDELLALSVFRRPMKPLIFFVWSSLALQRRLLNNF